MSLNHFLMPCFKIRNGSTETATISTREAPATCSCFHLHPSKQCPEVEKLLNGQNDPSNQSKHTFKNTQTVKVNHEVHTLPTDPHTNRPSSASQLPLRATPTTLPDASDGAYKSLNSYDGILSRDDISQNTDIRGSLHQPDSAAMQAVQPCNNSANCDKAIGVGSFHPVQSINNPFPTGHPPLQEDNKSEEQPEVENVQQIRQSFRLDHGENKDAKQDQNHHIPNPSVEKKDLQQLKTGTVFHIYGDIKGPFQIITDQGQGTQGAVTSQGKVLFFFPKKVLHFFKRGTRQLQPHPQFFFFFQKS